MKRTFRVEAEVHAIDHVVYEVEAEGADQAVELVENGGGVAVERQKQAGSEFDIRAVVDARSGARTVY
jgi:hypothetical protein